jgi:hypothetical protein
MSVLSDVQVRAFIRDGAVLVEGLFPSFAAAAAQAEAFYPPPGAEVEEAPLPYGGDVRAAMQAKDMEAARAIMGAANRDSPVQRFPLNKEKLQALNLLSVEPQLLSMAAQLLHGGAPGSEHELRLAQSSLISQCGMDADEAAPVPVITSTLVAPPSEPDAIEVTLFYADAAHAPGSALVTKADHSHAFAPVPLGSHRLTQHIIMRKAEAEWVSSDAPVRSLSGHGDMLGALLPAQRTVLGFPRPGHEYWKAPGALALAVARYPAMDPAPYVHCENGAPADFREQFEAGVGAPRREDLPARVFEKPSTGGGRHRLAPPEEAAGTSGRVLSDEQVARWREEGYIFISGIWPKQVIDDAYNASVEMAPFPNPDGSQPSSGKPVFGFEPRRPGPKNSLLGTARPGAFPYHESPALSAVTLHPRILSAVAELLDTRSDELRLTQSMVGGKYGGKELEESEYAQTFQRGPDGTTPGMGNARGDQGFHNDFGNNTITFPARNPRHWAQPEEVQSILFYGDFDGEDTNAAGGGTAFVPGLGHTLDGRLAGGLSSFGAKPNQGGNPPEDNKLYDVERQAAYTKGSVFLYSLGTWHRGTPVEPHGIRRIQFNCYKKREAEWVGGDNGVGSPSAKAMSELAISEGFDVAAFMSKMLPVQRCILGFPAVGSSYWDTETLAATAERYPEMDMAPYAEGVAVSASVSQSAKL